MAAFVIPSIFTAVDKFSAPVRKMSSNVQKFGRRAEVGLARAERGFRRLLSPLARARKMLGGFGLLLGTTVIIGAIGGMISVFMDFEQANANLASIMATATKPELIALQADAKRLGATTAKTATEVVGLQESFARLGFETPQIINMTEATISGSIAMQGELAATAELVGAMVKTFDDFSSIDTPQIIDQLTVATQSSALNFEKLQTALPIVAGAANAAGIPFTRLTALLGKLSDAGIDTSSSATALRNIFIESAKQGLSYSKILDKIEKNQDKLTTANDEFGKRAAVPAAILAKNIRATEELDKKLQSAAKGQALSGAASLAAAKQLDTLGGSLTILNSAWEGFILSLEDGTGQFSQTLKRITQVATEMLSLASGTAKAEDKLDALGKRTRVLAERGIFWLKVIRNIIIGLVAMKIALLVARGALFIYNVALGISAVIQGKSAIALRSSTIALKAYALAAKIVTAAQWLWNAATSGAIFKILLQVAGIIASTVATTASIIAISSVTAAQWLWNASITAGVAVLALLTSPIFLIIAGILLLISLFLSFRRNWEMIKEAFKTGGIIAGLKAIGVTILDALLMPLQQVFELMSKLPGVGGLAASVVTKIQDIRGELGINTTTDETGKEIINPAATVEQARTERFESAETQKTKIIIQDETGRAKVDTDNNLIPVILEPTFNF